MITGGKNEIKAAFTGPIPTLNTPFFSNGEIDHRALRRLIDFDIAAGCKAIVLTYGDSLFSVLNDDEISEITKTVVEHTGKRALVVAADKPWWTGKAVEFAEYARGIGADMVMVTPPDWGMSCTAESYVDHYAAITEHIPVMIVTAPLISRGMSFALDTMRQVLDEVPGVVAVKDDFCGEFARRLSLLLHDKWAVWSGGMKQNHMNMMPYGCDGYLSTFISFKPAIAHDYWNCIKANDLSGARRIISEYDIPFFDYIMRLQGGFDAGIHGVLEWFGMASRWRRKPYYSLNDEEMSKLGDFLRQKSLL